MRNLDLASSHTSSGIPQVLEWPCRGPRPKMLPPFSPPPPLPVLCSPSLKSTHLQLGKCHLTVPFCPYWVHMLSPNSPAHSLHQFLASFCFPFLTPCAQGDAAWGIALSDPPRGELAWAEDLGRQRAWGLRGPRGTWGGRPSLTPCLPCPISLFPGVRPAGQSLWSWVTI